MSAIICDGATPVHDTVARAAQALQRAAAAVRVLCVSRSVLDPERHIRGPVKLLLACGDDADVTAVVHALVNTAAWFGANVSTAVCDERDVMVEGPALCDNSAAACRSALRDACTTLCVLPMCIEQVGVDSNSVEFASPLAAAVFAALL